VRKVISHAFLSWWGIGFFLPTDEVILTSPGFKKRGFRQGGTVVLVLQLELLSLALDLVFR
jgi:hypothetical protein